MLNVRLSQIHLFRKIIPLISIATILFLPTFFLSGHLAAQAPPLPPTFDWSMPDRFGPDADSDGLIDYLTTAEAISPTSWIVNVDACASTNAEQTTSTYRWSVPTLPDVESTICTAALSFPQQGNYEVTLTVVTNQTNSTEQATESTVTQMVTVKDILIVSLGDSYASGEGAPDKSASLFRPNPTWQNAEYHRSAFAGPAIAARQIEENDPKSSVTFVHLARSGARIIHEDPAEIELFISAQVTEAATLLGTREIDALLLSIGGNDTGFGRIVRTCMAIEPCNTGGFDVAEDGLSTQICDIVLETFGAIPGAAALCKAGADAAEEEVREFTNEWTKSAALRFEELAAPLPGRYDQLAVDLSALNVRTNKIYITEYANPTRQDSGELCPQADGRNGLPGFSEAEYRWVDQDIMTQMNGLVQAAADRNGWTYIDGISEGYATHGYCATDNWIVRLTQSIASQADLVGTLHPNNAGHAFTGGVIAAKLESDLLNPVNLLYMPTVFR